MTDIAMRLRSLADMYYQHAPYYTEAADEIERLQTEIGELTKGPEWENVYQETIGELRAVNERLTAALCKAMDELSYADLRASGGIAEAP